MPRARATHIGTIRYFVDVDNPQRRVKVRRTNKDRYYYLKEKDGGKWVRIFKPEFDAMWDSGQIKNQEYM